MVSIGCVHFLMFVLSKVYKPGDRTKQNNKKEGRPEMSAM
jgi:hypothetical protein